MNGDDLKDPADYTLELEAIKGQEKENIEVNIVAIYGRPGLGKTTFGVGEAIAQCLAEEKKRVVSNVLMVNLPCVCGHLKASHQDSQGRFVMQCGVEGCERCHGFDPIECLWAKSVKDIIRAHDCIIFWDEADKAVSSRASKSIYTTTLTKIMSNVRKKNVSTMIFTAQWRHCLAPETIVDGRRLDSIRVGDVVDCQNVVSVNRFEDAERYRLDLWNGSMIIATPEHRFSGEKGRLRKVTSLKPGHLLSVDWICPARDPEAIFAGIIHAEGGFVIGRKRTTWGGKYTTHFYKARVDIDSRESELLEFLRGFFKKHNVQWSESKKRGSYGLSIQVDNRESVLYLKDVYDRIVQSENNFLNRSFLAGFFEGDGWADTTRNSVGCSQNKPWHREIVLGKLNSLGFLPEVTSREKISKLIPKVHATTVIRLNAAETQIFMQEIGFISKAKSRKILGKIRSIKRLENGPVIDIALDGNHLFYANGVLSHNSVDNLVRANCKYVAYPRKSLNSIGCPQAYFWNSVEKFEVQIIKKDGLDTATIINSNYTLDYIKSTFDSRYKIPLEMTQSIDPAEAKEVTDVFLKHCDEIGFIFPEKRGAEVIRLALKDWSENQEVPYSKAALDKILFQLYLRGLYRLDAPRASAGGTDGASEDDVSPDDMKPLTINVAEVTNEFLAWCELSEIKFPDKKHDRAVELALKKWLDLPEAPAKRGIERSIKSELWQRKLYKQ